MKYVITSTKVRMDNKEEYQQVLTYRSEGRFYLNTYDSKHNRLRREYAHLSDNDTALMNILLYKLIEDYEFQVIVPEGDRWEMTLEDDDYEAYSFYGGMNGFQRYGVNFTELIVSMTGFENLYAFG